jgi:hypothetical protein
MYRAIALHVVRQSYHRKYMICMQFYHFTISKMEKKLLAETKLLAEIDKLLLNTVSYSKDEVLKIIRQEDFVSNPYDYMIQWKIKRGPKEMYKREDGLRHIIMELLGKNLIKWK